MKIKELLKNGIEKLNKYKIEDSILKAKLLLEHELGVQNTYLVIRGDDEISNKNILQYERNLDKLIEGIPIQYIIKSQEFYGLTFYVDENVLIPQPDTEILVEEVVGIAKSIEGPKILDICTGSGAIAISLAKNLNAPIYASDISKKALEIAKINATTNNVNIKFIESDMFENINEKFDIIVSNPPYIETEVIDNLSKEVKHEPRIALDGGEDGLKFYKILTEQSEKYLNANGILVVEIGYNQKEKVIKLFEQSGFRKIYSKKDLGNNDRIVVGRK